MKKKLLIFGAGETATIASEFFNYDSDEELVGFIVDDIYWKKDKMLSNLPIFPLSKVKSKFSNKEFKIFVALSYGKLNREREKVYKLFISMEYEFASYISSKANVWRTAKIGNNCMIFEGNNIQHNSVIKNNVILWSGNHIGHGSIIHDSVYISSHVCVAGFSEIKERCFLGVNSTITDKIIIEEDCFIGASSLVNKNTDSNSVYTGVPAVKNLKVSAKKLFKVNL
jgi:sugar O-acyltransferase (sialic acid O-acetyltransferase NeuD family)